MSDYSAEQDATAYAESIERFETDVRVMLRARYEVHDPRTMRQIRDRAAEPVETYEAGASANAPSLPETTRNPTTGNPVTPSTNNDGPSANGGDE